MALDEGMLVGRKKVSEKGALKKISLDFRVGPSAYSARGKLFRLNRRTTQNGVQTSDSLRRPCFASSRLSAVAGTPL